jgi:circadian clock protein KaiB
MGKRPTRREPFVVRLYVADRELTAVRAIANLEALCREFLPDGCELEIIDILREPQRGLDDNIMVTPTLIKLAPPPARRIFGDLSNRARLLDALGLTGLEHFKVGEVVARRESPDAMRGKVVRVTDDGYFVTVQWSGRVGPQGRESTHRPDDLVRATD